MHLEVVRIVAAVSTLASADSCLSSQGCNDAVSLLQLERGTNFGVSVQQTAPSGGQMQKTDTRHGSQAVDVGSNSAVAKTAALAVQFAAHESECAGPQLDSCAYYNGKFLEVSPYFENGTYSLCGHQLVAGNHLLHAMYYCAQASYCGGFSVHPEGFATLWHTAAGFSVNESKSLDGYRCYQKLTTDKVENMSDNLTFAHDVGYMISEMNYASICNATCLTEASKEEHVQRSDQADADFGRQFESPVNFYVMPDGDVKVEATFGEARLNDAREYIAQSENICKSR